jgi:hypothetical protein
MKWRRLGLVFCPDRQQPWMASHAALPTPVALDGDVVRVFFSTRDAGNRSSIGFVDIDMRDPARILRVSETPVLAPGQFGTFDDSGVSIGCIVRSGEGDDHLYYMGWNLGRTAPWRNAIGLAQGSVRAGRFGRFADGPILDRDPGDAYSLSYPWVLRNAAGWQMWYGSHLRWAEDGTTPLHVIKGAVSDDGVAWRRDGRVVLGLSGAGETALARPCVLRDGERHRMWYAYRGERYAIGYAESADGTTWQRRDSEAGLALASEGWDAEMQCYPCVFDHGGRRYMAYNGNGYGRSGFGFAVLEAD